MCSEKQPESLCPDPAILCSLLANELTDEQESELNQHVACCVPCQSWLDARIGEASPILILRPHLDDSDGSPPTIPGLGPLALLDRGGMGLIYRARDLRLNREVAIKVMTSSATHKPEYLRRFRAETEITAQLIHPGIVPLHQVGELADGRPYYTMKLVEGKTLAAILRERPEPTADILSLIQTFSQVCQAVAYAHGKDVLHRDLKPLNIMVGQHGDVQVMDWGIAKPITLSAELTTGDDGRASVVTAFSSDGLRTRGALGTPAYMAPEQVHGRVDQVDKRTDVFGLGAVLCEILTGEPPCAASDSAVLQSLGHEARLANAYERLRRTPVDRELITLAEECLAVERAERPADASVVAGAVVAYLASLQDRLQQARVDRERQKVRAEEERRSRKLRALLTATALALVIVAGWSSMRQQQQAMNDARRHDRDQQVATAMLDEAYLFADQYSWKAAASKIDDLNKRRQPDTPADLTRRVREAEMEIAWANELDRIRLEKSTLIRHDNHVNDRFEHSTKDWRPRNISIHRLDANDAIADREYFAVFTSAGFASNDDTSEKVAGQIRASRIRSHWRDALDDWAALTKDIGRRERLLQIARRIDPADVNNALRRAELWDDVDELLNVASTIDLSTISPRLLAALASRLSFDDRGLAPLLRQASARHPQDFTLHHVLAAATIQSDPAESRGHAQAAIALRPDAAVAYNTLGIAYQGLQRPHDAIVAFSQAIRLNPDDADAYTNQGTAFYDAGELPNAIESHLQAVRLSPTLDQAWKNLSIAYTTSKDFESALHAINKAIALQPDDPSFHSQLGNVYAEQGQFGPAIAAYNDAISRSPDFAMGYYNLGVACVGDRRVAEAIVAYEKAIALDQTFPQPHVNLGYVHLNSGDIDRARASFNKALKIDPRLSEAHVGIGNAYFNNEDFDRAIGPFRRALEITPKDVIVHHNLGTCLMRTCQYAEALSTLRKALELNPQFVHSQVSISIVHDKLGHYEKSIEACRAALAISPDLVPAHGVMALVYRNMGDFENARLEFQKVLALTDETDPNRDFNLARLAECERFLSIVPRIPEFVAGTVRPVDATETLMLAETCRHRRQSSDAVRFYREAFADQPSLAENADRQYRFHAARTALLAARHETELGNETAASQFRSQAREWLLADVRAAKLLVAENPSQQLKARSRLTSWKADPALSGVLDVVVHTLPAAEHAPWREFWNEFDALQWRFERAVQNAST